MRITRVSTLLIILFLLGGNSKTSGQTSPVADPKDLTIQAVLSADRFLNLYIGGKTSETRKLISRKGPFQQKLSAWERSPGRDNLINNEKTNFEVLDSAGEQIRVRVTLQRKTRDWDGNGDMGSFSYDFVMVRERHVWKVFDIDPTYYLVVKALLTNEGGVSDFISRAASVVNSDQLDTIINELKAAGTDNKKLVEVYRTLRGHVTHPISVLWLLEEEGLALKQLGEKEKAREVFEQMLRLSPPDTTRLRNAMARIRLADLKLEKGKNAEVVLELDAAISLLLSEKNAATTQMLYIRYAAAGLYNAEDYAKAADYFQRGLTVASKSGHDGWVAVFYDDLGDTYFNSKNHLEAIKNYEALVKVLESPINKTGFEYGGDRYSLPTAYASIGKTFRAIGRLDDSVTNYVKACESTAESSTAGELEESCGELVEMYLKTDAFQKAAKQLDTLTERLFKMKAETELINVIKRACVILALEKGRSLQAEKLLDRWATRVSPQKVGEIDLARLVLYQITFKWSLVETVGKRLFSSPHSGDVEKVFAAIAIATALVAQEQKDQGKQWMARAEAVARGVREKEAVQFVRLMKMFVEMDEQDAAKNLPILESIIQENPGDNFLSGFAYYFKGVAFLSIAEEGEWKDKAVIEKGLEALRTSISIYEKLPREEGGMGTALSQMAISLFYKEMGKPELALESIRQANDYDGRNGPIKSVGVLDALEAEIAVAAGDVDGARRSFTKSVDGLASQRNNVRGGIQGRLNFNSKIRETLRQAVANEIKARDTESAVAFVDLAKGQILNELSGPGRHDGWLGADSVPKNVLFTSKIVSAAELNKVETAGEGAFAATKKKLTEIPVPSDVAILNYFVDEDGDLIRLFVYTSGRWRYSEIRYDLELRKHIKNFQSVLRNQKADFRTPAKELYGLLIKPVEALLSNKTSLVIIPDSVLWQLPFQALIRTGSGSIDELSRERFLIEDFSVHYAFSVTHMLGAGELRKAREKRSTRVSKDVLAIGNAAFDYEKMVLKPEPDDVPFNTRPSVVHFTIKNGVPTKYIPKRSITLEPLPGAAIEAGHLVGIYGPARTDRWIDAESSKPRFLKNASSYRIIHFATHGILDDENGLNSSLAFTQRPFGKVSGSARRKGPGTSEIGEERLLTSQEILRGLKLQADLVVLSACDTANGEVSEGEGLVGLTWAFLGSGASNVVASQWRVNDGKTPELMKDFHARMLFNPGHPVSRSLRESTLKLMQDPDYFHPYFWAGFSSIGGF